MKKAVTFTILTLLLISILPLIQAANETTSSSERETKIQKAFSCLEDKAATCKDLTTQEIALTILATPDNIFDDCVSELESRKTTDNWGNIKDTSLAILALKHAGKTTTDSENWLLAQNQTPTNLIWYLQQDSKEKTQCHISYTGTDATINVDTNKKIDSNAGDCLTRAQSNFWLQVSEDCYDEEFSITCDQKFIANLLYKNKNSPTIYVLEGTQSGEALSGLIKLKIKSKCFGTSSCNYEATAWATWALLETGHDVQEFIPYVIAMADTNEQYLPQAFIYALTGDNNDATNLIASQKLGNYWEAKSSAYNKYYDTALALISLGDSSSEQISKAEDWLLFSQGPNGCWQNSVRDTAIVLWALADRKGRPGTGTTTTSCAQGNFFCVTQDECPSEDLRPNYHCSSLTKDTCCATNNLKLCSEYEGEVCDSDLVCVGISREASDTTQCCTGTCEERVEENECEQNFYNCFSDCPTNKEEAPYSCDDSSKVCCRTKTTSSSKGSSWWIWLLIILILITAGAIIYIKREKLKPFWFKIKSKFRRGKGRGNLGGGRPPSMPPRPGFPPVRRHPPIRPQTPPRSYSKQDSNMDDTFKKLRDLSS